MSLINYLTRIHFADRVLEDALAEELRRCRGTRPLVITESVGVAGEMIERLWGALPATVEPVTFAPPRGHFVAADFHAASEQFAASGCDAVIGFGGARAIDLARLLGNTGTAVISIPTDTETVGLGPLGVTFARFAERGAQLPAAILCDATLTVGAEPKETAASGMDALVHCLEAFLGTGFNPPADGIAFDGLRRAALNLEAAVCDGRDLVARRELLVAALNAGLASQKGLGGMEAAARALEAEAHPAISHGTFHAALLPEVLAFNAPAVSDRFAIITAALGLPQTADLSLELAKLSARAGLPARLSEVGIASDTIDRAALAAAADTANRTNPRHATASDYHAIMTAAL